MLLTRFKVRRLRFAMTTVSHTDENCATRSDQCREGRPRPSSPPTNRTFSLFKRPCANPAPVTVFPHAAETLIDIRHVQHRMERVRGHSETAYRHLWKMDFRQVAQRNRAEAAGVESPSLVFHCPTQEIPHCTST